MGLFQALETGKRALLTHQLNMSTIGQNIANVDTPGYSRQRAEKTSTDPLRTALGMLGSGVTISHVRQVRDLFLGNQFRQENKSLGRWDFKEKILSQVETMFNEPGGESLRSHMDAFFNSFSQLANAPESITNRNDVLSKAKTLVNDFRQIDGRLKALSSSIDRDLSIRIQEINQNAAEVATLNSQIV
ncbi:MAG: flagellar hook-associated protein FlgK, partial [candidate division Zixibacteria bacterium]|nr:flagellar hook-associated protein FlgK [candidate division Zixibacteria bacterium]